MEKFPIGIKQDASEATSHFAKQLEISPITNKNEIALLNDLRARTFDNGKSGRKIVIDGNTYRVHVRLVEDEGS